MRAKIFKDSGHALKLSGIKTLGSDNKQTLPCRQKLADGMKKGIIEAPLL
jgi:hypothetical protein